MNITNRIAYTCMVAGFRKRPGGTREEPKRNPGGTQDEPKRTRWREREREREKTTHKPNIPSRENERNLENIELKP